MIKGMLMCIPPWGLLGHIWFPLAIIGIAVQIVGLAILILTVKEMV